MSSECRRYTTELVWVVSPSLRPRCVPRSSRKEPCKIEFCVSPTTGTPGDVPPAKDCTSTSFTLLRLFRHSGPSTVSNGGYPASTLSEITFSTKLLLSPSLRGKWVLGTQGTLVPKTPSPPGPSEGSPSRKSHPRGLRSPLSVSPHSPSTPLSLPRPLLTFDDPDTDFSSGSFCTDVLPTVVVSLGKGEERKGEEQRGSKSVEEVTLLIQPRFH